MSKRIGTVSIIVTDRTAQAARVNDLLTEHGKIIIGSMGLPHAPKGIHGQAMHADTWRRLPYAPKGIHIISLIIHGSTDEIGALTGMLGSLEGVEVKSALTKA